MMKLISLVFFLARALYLNRRANLAYVLGPTPTTRPTSIKTDQLNDAIEKISSNNDRMNQLMLQNRMLIAELQNLKKPNYQPSLNPGGSIGHVHSSHGHSHRV